jgi:cell division protease FtsH
MYIIHDLANSPRDHTTLLIAAEQVALLSEYVTLARLLQPSIVVRQDVDLIGKNHAVLRRLVTSRFDISFLLDP